MITKHQDYSRSKGGMALAARLRRISERLDRDGTRIYASYNIRFEQRWYGVLRQILENGPMSIGDIASTLRITHVSVSQATASLQKAGFVRAQVDKTDARRRQIGLTKKGEALIEKLGALWQAFNDAAAEMNSEAGDVVRLLDQLEDALERKSMYDRIAERAGISK